MTIFPVRIIATKYYIPIDNCRLSIAIFVHKSFSSFHLYSMAPSKKKQKKDNDPAMVDDVKKETKKALSIVDNKMQKQMEEIKFLLMGAWIKRNRIKRVQVDLYQALDRKMEMM